MYIALYHEEETPPLFFRYPITPYHPGSTSDPLTPQPVKPRPCLMASASQPEP